MAEQNVPVEEMMVLTKEGVQTLVAALLMVTMFLAQLQYTML